MQFGSTSFIMFDGTIHVDFLHLSATVYETVSHDRTPKPACMTHIVISLNGYVEMSLFPRDKCLIALHHNPNVFTV
jgi:hypothetical protein